MKNTQEINFHKKIVYLGILERIRLKGDTEDWKCNLFNAFGRTMAINWKALVTVPCLGDYPNYEDKIRHFYPPQRNCNQVFKISDIKEMLLNNIDEFETYKSVEDIHIQIGTQKFAYNRVADIIKIADSLNVKKIKLVSQNERKPSLFLISDVELLITPVYDLVYIKEENN